jgi:hypothetical protein
MKKHVFLSFNVEYGTQDGQKTVTLLDGDNGMTYSAPTYESYAAIVRSMAVKLALSDRLRIEDINMGVRA